MDQPGKNGAEKSDDEPEAIDPAHLPAVLEGLEQAERRQFPMRWRRGSPRVTG
jgi:hypothetical protein